MDGAVWLAAQSADGRWLMVREAPPESYDRIWTQLAALLDALDPPRPMLVAS